MTSDIKLVSYSSATYSQLKLLLDIKVSITKMKLIKVTLFYN